jgi:molecular chaperone GrpE (heat shock protein)
MINLRENQMAEESKHEDPTAKWPEEVKQAYEHMKVPSLYDCFLANEKMSVELRKQNRDVKTAVEGMQKIATVLDSIMEMISEEWDELDEEDEEGDEEGGTAESPRRENGRIEDYENLTEFEIQLLADKQLYLEQTHATLTETMDSIFELTLFAQQMSQQLLSTLPEKEGFLRQEPSWRPLIEEIINSFIAHLDHHRNRFQARLEEMLIYVLQPKPGEKFDKVKHLKLEEVSGGETDTIAQVIRVGYLYDRDVLRQAEVIVFN